MACRECYKRKRCFEQRGVCSEYRSVKEIREEIRGTNDELDRDWNRGDRFDDAAAPVGGYAAQDDPAAGDYETGYEDTLDLQACRLRRDSN